MIRDSSKLRWSPQSVAPNLSNCLCPTVFLLQYPCVLAQKNQQQRGPKQQKNHLNGRTHSGDSPKRFAPYLSECKLPLISNWHYWAPAPPWSGFLGRGPWLVIPDSFLGYPEPTRNGHSKPHAQNETPLRVYIIEDLMKKAFKWLVHGYDSFALVLAKKLHASAIAWLELGGRKHWRNLEQRKLSGTCKSWRWNNTTYDKH